MNAKKLLTAYFAAAFVFGASAAAFAATEVSTYSGLVDAVTKGGEIKIMNDIILDSTITIPADVSVTLDLNGNAISIEQTYEYWWCYDCEYDCREDCGEDCEDYCYGEWFVSGYNAIFNEGGTLVVTGNGTINSTKNAISNYMGDLTVENGTFNAGTNPIWNGGTVTITTGVFDGYNTGIYNEGTVIINDGTFFGYEWAGIENYGEVTINNGTFSGWYGIYNGGDVTINNAVFIGTYDDVDEIDVYSDTELDLSNAEYDSIGGFTATKNYTGITQMLDITVATGSNVSIELDNAKLSGCKLRSGSYSGTVSSISSTYLYGGTYTEELMNSMLAAGFKLSNGYQFVATDSYRTHYAVSNVGHYSVTIVTADEVKGNLGGFKYSYIGGSGSSLKPTISLNVTKGGTLTFSATATPNENYVFKGWYTNPDGTGQALSNEAVLTNLTYTVTEDTVIYGVFISNEEFAAFEALAMAWMGDYASKTEFTVSSKPDMSYLAYLVNIRGYEFSGKTVNLDTDLIYAADEVYEPIGNAAYQFCGTFDGHDNTISGIVVTEGYDSVGIFGRTDTGAIIMNLTVTDCIFDSQNYESNVGAIVGHGNGTILENCTSIDMTLTGYFAGGIIGHSFGNITMRNVTVEGMRSYGFWKVGGLIGYMYEDMIVDGANVSDIGIAEGAEWSGYPLAGIVSHAQMCDFTLTNIIVDTPGCPLISTNYETKGMPIISSINGDSTYINAKCIIDAYKANVLSQEEGTRCQYIYISDEGTYQIDAIVTDDAAVDDYVDGVADDESSYYYKNIIVSGGTYDVDVDPYCDRGYITRDNKDGTFTVVKVVWTTDTDSGYYKDNGNIYGAMRYLFHTRVAEETVIVETGVNYVDSETKSNVLSSVGGSEPVFYGDIIEIPEGTDGTYWAVGYIIINVDGSIETFFSDPVECSPNFTNIVRDYPKS